MKKIIPITKKDFNQPFVATGVIIEKDGKFVMVQEGKSKTGPSSEGLWDRPGGWLDLYEDILVGAVREVKEETGLDVELTGFLGIYNYIKQIKDTDGKNLNIHGILLEFVGKVKSSKINIKTEEIQDVKWFSFEEIKRLDLRSKNIIYEIKEYLSGNIYSLDIIKTYTNYT